jgi:hypothetical protein
MAWAPYPVHAQTGGVSAPFTRDPRPSKRALQGGRGGIGRRTGFRFQRRKAWGFESPRPHHGPARPGGTAIQACNTGAMQILLALGLLLSHPQAIDGDTLRDNTASVIVLKTLMYKNAEDGSECPEERVLAEAASAYAAAWIAQARQVEAPNRPARQLRSDRRPDRNRRRRFWRTAYSAGARPTLAGSESELLLRRVVIANRLMRLPPRPHSSAAPANHSA